MFTDKVQQPTRQVRARNLQPGMVVVEPAFDPMTVTVVNQYAPDMTLVYVEGDGQPVRFDPDVIVIVQADDDPPMPQPTPDDPFPNPNPNPTVPTYSALHLMAEVYFGLWGAGKIPPGPMPDPEVAQRACTELLCAFGVTPTEVAPADSYRAASAVAAVCGVAA